MGQIVPKFSEPLSAETRPLLVGSEKVCGGAKMLRTCCYLHVKFGGDRPRRRRRAETDGKVQSFFSVCLSVISRRT